MRSIAIVLVEVDRRWIASASRRRHGPPGPVWPGVDVCRFIAGPHQSAERGTRGIMAAMDRPNLAMSLGCSHQTASSSTPAASERKDLVAVTEGADGRACPVSDVG